MKNTDLIKFLIKRAKKDSPKAFAFRLIRLAIISFYKLKMWLWWRNCRAIIDGDVVTNVMGSQMRFSMNDNGITQDLLYNSIREPYANNALLRLIKPGDVVIEIGANMGYYALQEAKAVGSKGKVYAIEPLSENMLRLKENMIRNQYKNIELFEMAIGDRNGVALLYRTKENNLCTLSEMANRDYYTTYPVSVQTLDTFIEGKRYPNLIRMDIEGYEYEALRGMIGILKEDRPLIIFIELHLDLLGEMVKPLAGLLWDNDFKIISASVEPHPAIMKSKFGTKATAYCDKQIGLEQGYNRLTLTDLLKNRIYSSGQIEWLELIVRR